MKTGNEGEDQARCVLGLCFKGSVFWDKPS
jgi:hypothetical protein